MPHFFCAEADEKQLVLTGENAHHITRVLRMKVGESLTVSTADGNRHEGVIRSLEHQSVTVEILTTTYDSVEPSVAVTLYQAMPKGDKMELILQKAVELGVTDIVPVLTRRCVSRPDPKSMAKKQLRYQKIVEAAAKQSGRGVVPTVHPLLSFDQLVQTVSNTPHSIVCYEGGGERLATLVPADCTNLSLIIGSEGGFEVSEIEALQAVGVQTATLGRLILRCETAPLAAISIIMQLTRNI